MIKKFNIKKIILLTFVLILTSVVTGCDIAEGDIKGKVSAPDNMKPPIEGKWKIVERLGKKEESSIEEEDIFIGSEGLFRKEAIIIGKEYTMDPTFRIKNVKTNDYFLYKYNKSYKDLGIKNERVQIITIMNEDQYFYEIVKDDESLIIYIDDNFYRMENIVEEIALEEVERYIEIEQSMTQGIDSWNKGEDLQTGVLLGLKTAVYDEKNDVSNWKYETLWLNAKDGKIISMYKLDDLLLPRKSGFWKVRMNREVGDRKITDEIKYTSDLVSTKAKDDDSSSLVELRAKRKNKDKSNLKNILYIGNDHISLENIEIDDKEKRTLSTYALDNIEEKKPIKLTDFVGDEGKKLFIEGAESVIELNDEVKADEKNIALTRKDGYWIFKGRVNYMENEEELYKDFNIKAIPPENVVKYDKLSIPWMEITSQIFGVVDAFSSPNEEFIITKTEKELMIYSLDNGRIKEKIETIELPGSTSIVMAEWATGRYPAIWENEVLKRDGVKIDE